MELPVDPINKIIDRINQASEKGNGITFLVRK